ncbi:phage portal protein [Nocardiopsis sp. CNR-923]|uniref:phage portal protein n=1 Tax=Nocardiopsis sp. CNR-923 TaxID=1904965 RepID=UPI0011816DF7|nr:phage portal protein [Nocardiopsis sp. CNR-923]
MPGSTDLLYALAELDEARKGYDEATVFYEGRPQEIYSSAKVRQLLRESQLHDLKNLNFAKTPVDEVVGRLRVTSVSAVDDDGRPHKEAQAALDRIWSRNKLDRQLPNLWKDVSQLKDGYLFVWPVLDEDGGVEDVDVIVNAPRTIHLVYAEDRPAEVDFAVKMWCSDRARGAEVHQARIYYPAGRIEYYETRPGTDCSLAKSWTFVHEMDHSYGVPLFHFRLPYPEHYWAYTAQLIINKLVITSVASIDRLGFPTRYGLIDPTADDTRDELSADDPDGRRLLPTDPDDLDDEDDDTRPRLRDEPGAFWDLDGYRSVGEFAAANPTGFIALKDWYVRSISQTTNTPLSLMDPQLRGQVSGESLKVAREPLTSKVLERQDRYTGALKDALEHALWLLGIEDAHVTVSWAPAGPTVAEEDPVDVELARAERVIRMLNELSSAVAVGVMSRQEANQIMDRLMHLVQGSITQEKGKTA